MSYPTPHLDLHPNLASSTCLQLVLPARFPIDLSLISVLLAKLYSGASFHSIYLNHYLFSPSQGKLHFALTFSLTNFSVTSMVLSIFDILQFVLGALLYQPIILLLCLLSCFLITDKLFSWLETDMISCTCCLKSLMSCYILEESSQSSQKLMTVCDVDPGGSFPH